MLPGAGSDLHDRVARTLGNGPARLPRVCAHLREVETALCVQVPAPPASARLSSSTPNRPTTPNPWSPQERRLRFHTRTPGRGLCVLQGQLPEPQGQVTVCGLCLSRPRIWRAGASPHCPSPQPGRSVSPSVDEAQEAQVAPLGGPPAGEGTRVGPHAAAGWAPA